MTDLKVPEDRFEVSLLSEKELADTAKRLHKPVLQYWREDRAKPSRDYRRTLFFIDGLTLYTYEDECWYDQHDDRLIEDPSLEDVEEVTVEVVPGPEAVSMAV